MDYYDDVKGYYNKGIETTRLDLESNRLEKIRTLDILERYLPQPPATIIDIGGATGVYSFELSKRGYEVHLRDITPAHITLSQEKNKSVEHKLKSIELGDARNLQFPDNFADIILLFGPLYHLVEEEDRKLALKEAYRVLKSGGIIFSAAISRFASLIDGFDTKNILDEQFLKILNQDLIDGQHKNPTDNVNYFTTAFFHHPDELYQEYINAGLKSVEILPIESFLGLLGNIKEYLIDPEKKKLLLTFVRKIENESSLIGASPHIMAIGRKLS